MAYHPSPSFRRFDGWPGENESDGVETYEFGSPPDFRFGRDNRDRDFVGDDVRAWKEDPRHVAWLQTGCNLSEVLALIYEISKGVSYYQIRHIIKCGEDEATQIRRPVERLLQLGYYDKLERYAPKNAMVFEGLPTACSASTDPDGFFKAMEEMGWFEKEGRFGDWSRMFVGCCNVDTGLNEPQHLPVPECTVGNIPVAKTYFKVSSSNWTNKRKCQMCYDSLEDVFAFPGRIAAKNKRQGLSMRPMMRVGVGVFLGVDRAPSDQRKPDWMTMLVLSLQHGREMEKLLDAIWGNCPSVKIKMSFIYMLSAGILFYLHKSSWADESEETPAMRTVNWTIGNKGKVQERNVEFVADFVRAVLNHQCDLLADYLRYFSDDSGDYEIYNMITAIKNLEIRAQARLELDPIYMSERESDMPADTPSDSSGGPAPAPAPKPPGQQVVILKVTVDTDDERAMRVIRPAEFIKDTFFESLKITVLYILDSGWDCSKFHVVLDEKSMRTDGWGANYRDAVARFLLDATYKNKLIDLYFAGSGFDENNEDGLPQDGDQRAALIKKYQEAVAKFKDETSADIPAWILQLIADRLNVTIILVMMNEAGAPQIKVEPRKERLVWETTGNYEKRRGSHNIQVGIGFDRETRRYVALGEDDLNKTFLLENSPDNMQGNLLEMLVKSQIVQPVSHLAPVEKYNNPKDSVSEIQLDIPEGDYSVLGTVDEAESVKLNRYWRYLTCWAGQIRILVDVDKDQFTAARRTEFRSLISTVMDRASVNVSFPDEIDEDDTQEGKQGVEAILWFNCESKVAAEELLGKVTANKIESVKSGWWKRVAINLVSKEVLDTYILDVDSTRHPVENVRIKRMRDTMSKALEAYGFDQVVLQGKKICGYYNNKKLTENYFQRINSERLTPSDVWKGMSVLDYVILDKAANQSHSLYISGIMDTSFEVVHINKTEHHPIMWYLRCVWLSLMSLVFQTGLAGHLQLNQNQRTALAETYARFHNVLVMVDFIRTSLRHPRWAGDSKAGELMQMLEAGNKSGIMLVDEHKAVVATILNLIIYEFEMEQKLSLSADRSGFVVKYHTMIGSKDTYFFNADNGVPRTLHDDTAQFLVRRNFKTRIIPNQEIRLWCAQYEDMAHKKWKLENPSSFFECVASTLVENRDPLKYRYADGAQAKNEFIDILNVIFSYYFKGSVQRMSEEMIDGINGEDEMAGRSSREEGAAPHSDHRTAVKVDIQYHRIQLQIRSLLSYHWDALKSSGLLPVNIQGGAGPIKFISIDVWNAFISYVQSEEYKPGPWELQILADSYRLNICVFDMLNPSQYVPFKSNIKGKVMEWVFKPMNPEADVWVLGTNDTSIDQHEFYIISRDRSKDTNQQDEQRVADDERYQKHFQRQVKITNHDKTAVCEKDSLVVDAMVVLGLSSNFYEALESYLDNIKRIRYYNVFKYQRKISEEAFEKMLNVFRGKMGANFDRLRGLFHSSGDELPFAREYFMELENMIGVMKVGDLPLKRGILQTFNMRMDALKRFVMDKLLENKLITSSQGQLVNAIEDIFSEFQDNSNNSVQFRRLLVLDNMEWKDIHPDRFNFKSHNITSIMKELLADCSDGERWDILRHHYGSEQWGESREERLKLVGERWKEYFEDGGYQKRLPSIPELRMLADRLKIRILVYLSKWYHRGSNKFRDLGYVQRVEDLGPDGNFALPLLFTINDKCLILELKDNILTRTGIDANVVTMDEFQKLRKLYADLKRNGGGENKFDKLMLNGTTNDPVNGFVYLATGNDPHASLQEHLKKPKKFIAKYELIMFHPDKAGSHGEFYNKLGVFGPQNKQKFTEIVDFFCGSQALSSVSYIPRLCWQILCDPVMRYLYHFEGKFPPSGLWDVGFELGRKGQPDFKYNNEDDPEWIAIKQRLKYGQWSNGLGARMGDWYSASDQEQVNWNHISARRVPGFPVHILVKGRTPQNNHGLLPSSIRPLQFGNAISVDVRDKAVMDFKRRFIWNESPEMDVGNQESGQDRANRKREWYAAMIAVRKSVTDLKLDKGVMKAYPEYNFETGNIDMTRIYKVHLVNPTEFPDFQTLREKEEDQQRDNVWMNQWCGLKWCVQGAFYFARHDAKFRIMNSMLGWVDEMYQPAREGWARDNLWKDDHVCHAGMTNPHHIDFDCVSGLLRIVQLMYATAFSSNLPQQERNIREFVVKMSNMMNANVGVIGRGTMTGLWRTEENLNDFFNKMEEDKKREESIELMRLLAMLFNLEFIILKPFPENDINSMCMEMPGCYLFKMREEARNKGMNDYGHVYGHFRYYYSMYHSQAYGMAGKVGQAGIAWAKSPVPLDAFKQHNTIPRTGAVYPTMHVFVTWNHGRWHLLKPVEVVDTAAESKRRREEHERRQSNKQRNDKTKGEGGDWRGDRRKKPSSGGGGGEASGGGAGGSGGGSADKNGGGYGAYSGGGFGGGFDDLCNHADEDDWGDNDGYDNDLPEDEGNQLSWWERFEDEDEFEGGAIDYYDENTGEGNVLDRYLKTKFCTRRDKRVGNGGRLALKDVNNRLFSTHFLKEGHIRRVNEYQIGPKRITFNEDRKEIHFLTQKVPLGVCILRYLMPYGFVDLKLQIGQAEQSKMLGWIMGCCFDETHVEPIKNGYTTRFVVVCRGFRKDRVLYYRIDSLLESCFCMSVESFRAVCDYMYSRKVVPVHRMNVLRKQIQFASDELWAEDFRVSLVMARTLIQGALEGEVQSDPNYLSPELASRLNRRVFSRVSNEDRMHNLQVIRSLMNSDFAGQILPLFRVVFHPDLHTWNRLLPAKVVQKERAEGYWDWDVAVVESEGGMPLKMRRAL